MVGAFVSGLLDVTAWIVAVAAGVAVVALVTGPYRWAMAVRHRTVSLARVAAWVAAHREGPLASGIVAGIVVLLVADPSWLGIVLLAVVVGGFEFAVQRLADLHRRDIESRGARREPVTHPGVRSGHPSACLVRTAWRLQRLIR